MTTLLRLRWQFLEINWKKHAVRSINFWKKVAVLKGGFYNTWVVNSSQPERFGAISLLMLNSSCEFSQKYEKFRGYYYVSLSVKRQIYNFPHPNFLRNFYNSDLMIFMRIYVFFEITDLCRQLTYDNWLYREMSIWFLYGCLKFYFLRYYLWHKASTSDQCNTCQLMGSLLFF